MQQAIGLVATLVSIGLGFAFAFANRLGVESRRAIAGKFADALRTNSPRPQIGGVRWIVANGQFWPIAEEGGSRGVTYDAEAGNLGRRQRELAKFTDRGSMFSTGIVVLFLCGVAIWFLAGHRDTDLYIVTGGLDVIAAMAFSWSCWFLFWEIAYRHGFQGMKGAMVLDPEPSSASQAEVESQKAHGDARLATESEVIAVGSSGAGRQSSVHDQEF